MQQATILRATLERNDHQSTACVRSQFVAPNIRRLVTCDVDEFAEAALDWDIELTQLRRGGFEGAATIVPLGPVLLYSSRCSPWLLERFATPDDCLTLARPGDGCDAVTIQGREVQEGEVLLCGPNAEGETVTRGVRRWASISIKLDFLKSQSHWLEFAGAKCAGVELRAPGREWTQHFLGAVQWMASTALEYSDAVAYRDIAGSLLDALLMRVNALYAVESPAIDGRGARLARRTAVARAREYVDANLAEPIRLSALCEHARTQSRSLEYAFREVLGLSPIAYVRAKRLHRVRKLLRSTVVRTRSISEIALDCGFWHLSQFAADYKHLFAESPSTTYRRTKSLLPRVERRRMAATI